MGNAGAAADERFARAIFVLHRFMSPARRRQMILLALLMPLSALAEMLGIAAIVPLLSLLSSEATQGEMSWLAEWLASAAAWAGVSSVAMASALFVIAAIAVAVTRLLLARSSQRFAYGLGHEIVVDIQRRLLFQPYLFHARHHSSQVLASLDKVEQFIFSLVLPVLQGVGAAIIAMFIIAALLWVDAASTMLALMSVAAAYAVVLLATRRRLDDHSTVVRTAYDLRIKAVQDSVGGIRDIIVDHSQSIFLETIRTIDRRLMRTRMEMAILAIAPRFVIEAVGMVVFAVLAVVLASGAGGLAAALPVLGALALGAQRLLPLVQQIYRGWASLIAGRSTMAQLIDLMQLPVEESVAGPPLEFRDSIRVEGVGFRYDDDSGPVLAGVDLVIRKGARIALTGRTGSGKTTLTDLVMGLFPPTSGRILIDGVELNRTTARAWQRNIAHVPQSIFLADASIARNIAFASPDGPIDMERVRHAASIAQLEFVARLPLGFATEVGERGIRLSGGQRQRLGLARAIYKQAPVLLLDEATSALDDATEEAVLRALDALGDAGCTILIVAHRASTIATCDQIVRIDNGRIVDLARRGQVDL